MPHSLRAKLSGLRYKGILEDKDYKRLCKALDNEKVLEQIRAEIERCLEAINYIKAMPIQLYTPNEIEARKLTYEQCLGFIDKYTKGNEE